MPDSQTKLNTPAQLLRTVCAFALGLVSVCWTSGCGASPPRELRIGLIADCQYADAKTSGVRRYRDSVAKLRSCVDHLNQLDLDLVMHLGDFIDRDFESFDVVGPIYEDLTAPHYHVLGNHDFSVADDLKQRVPAVLGMPARYYDLELKGWRLVVLDGNDISYHASVTGSPEQLAADEYYKSNGIKSPKWNGALGDEQLAWLKEVLTDASERQQPTLLFCHFPVHPENVHNLWNAIEVIELAESQPCVVGYINGHNHSGNYGQRAGIHYLTLKGMVNTEENAYAVMRCQPGLLEVTGFGREQNRSLPTRSLGD